LACFYRWNSEEHNDELLLAQHGVADESVSKPREAAAAFFDEEAVGGDVIAVDGHSFGREQGQLAEGVAFVQALEQPDEVGVAADDFGVAADGADFVVAVLEEEHAFFLLEHRDRDHFVDAFGESSSWRGGAAGGAGAAVAFAESVAGFRRGSKASGTDWAGVCIGCSPG
jgi:hypothetical protein